MKPEDLPTTPDAHVWANEFIKTVQQNPAIALDEETMRTWFANSITSGYDLAQREARLQQAIAQVVDIPERIGSKLEALLLGIRIIAKYEKDPLIEAEHDVIFVGDYEISYTSMSLEEKSAMDEWGWFKKYESWAIFT